MKRLNLAFTVALLCSAGIAAPAFCQLDPDALPAPAPAASEPAPAPPPGANDPAPAREMPSRQEAASPQAAAPEADDGEVLGPAPEAKKTGGGKPAAEPARLISEPSEDKAEKEEDAEEAGKGDSKLDKAEEESEPAEKPADIDPLPHYKHALQLIEEKNYAPALAELQKIAELNPEYWQARYQIAFIHQITGKTRLATREYRKLLKVKPNDVQTLINLGTLLKAADDLPGAEEQFRKAIESYFYSFPAHYDLANVLVKQGRFEEALKEYKVCLKLKPKDAMVHNNMGVIYQRRQYLEEAEEEFRRAAQLQPSNKIFQTNLGLVRQQLKKGV